MTDAGRHVEPAGVALDESRRVRDSAATRF
jgi:hypothetical protein